MSTAELAHLVLRTLDTQQEYFKEPPGLRKRALLIESKKLEAELRAAANAAEAQA